MSNEGDVFNMFGLSATQTEILYNMEKVKTEYDIQHEQNSDKRKLKEQWLGCWKQAMVDAYTGISKSDSLSWFTEDELIKRVKATLESFSDKMWFFLVVLEAMLFTPYHPLTTETKGVGEKSKVIPSKKFDAAKPTSATKQDAWLKFLMGQCGQNPEFVDHIRKTHKSVLNQLSGRSEKILTFILVDIFVAVVFVATAGLAAPLLAPTIAAAMGASFTGLTGAALTSASLAFIGGGAIAAGGFGMLGGTLVIAGGGGLLGLLAGGVAAGGGALRLLDNKPFVILQAAKLEVTIREIILNTFRDVHSAKTVLERFKELIVNLNKNIADMELNDKNNNSQIKNLKKTVDMLHKSALQLERFISSFELGMEYAEENG